MTKPLDPIEPVTATYPTHTPSQGIACHNCQTMLQGGYCHVCGQHAHNPLRSFRHAVEDVFESFWHVDGRIFRTLRDLLIPGKVSRDYLDGHRVRYIAPLRLYVILSLITFFVAHFLTANLKGGLETIADVDNASSAQTTVAAVERERDLKLASLEKSLQQARDSQTTIGITAISAAQETVKKQAQTRIDQINRENADKAESSVQADVSPVLAEATGSDQDSLNHIVETNARLFSKDKRTFVERLLTHTPGILLALLPLFALMLRIVYLLRPMGYLEHLVVALYSHAFLLLIALSWILMLLLDRALGSTFLGAIAATVFPVLVPVYLFFSQKRVYGEGWWMTLLRFVVTSFLYFVLATLATVAVISMALLIKA